MVFKDLGLMVIDEEQKFGVKTKEQLKQLKVNVDCLSLSATPIPRTLHFSLMGARDLSVINTPPPATMAKVAPICGLAPATGPPILTAGVAIRDQASHSHRGRQPMPAPSRCVATCARDGFRITDWSMPSSLSVPLTR